MGLAEDGLKKTLGTLIDYLRLDKYIAIQIEKRRGVSEEFYKEGDFWKAALGTAAYSPSSREVLPEGAIVTLKGFQITEWVPLNPGRYWTEIGFVYRERAKPLKDLIYFSKPQPMLAYAPDGKTFMMLGGMGTVKPKPQRFKPVGSSSDSGSYSLLCATSSGYCWSGIPILVSDTVYRSFRSLLRWQKKVEADIVGIYQTNPALPEELVLAARGEEITKELKQLITDCSGMPQNVIVVDSILNIQKRVSEIPIKAVAWTLFQGIKPGNTDKFFNFTYHTFDPQNEVSHNIARNFILNYFNHFRGKRILTDYDETRPSFSVLTKRDIEEITRFRQEEREKEIRRRRELESSQEKKIYIPSITKEPAPILKEKLRLESGTFMNGRSSFYAPYFGPIPRPFMPLKSVLSGLINSEDVLKLLSEIYKQRPSEARMLSSQKDSWSDSAPYFGGE